MNKRQKINLYLANNHHLFGIGYSASLLFIVGLNMLAGMSPYLGITIFPATMAGFYFSARNPEVFRKRKNEINHRSFKYIGFHLIKKLLNQNKTPVEALTQEVIIKYYYGQLKSILSLEEESYKLLRGLIKESKFFIDYFGYQDTDKHSLENALETKFPTDQKEVYFFKKQFVFEFLINYLGKKKFLSILNDTELPILSKVLTDNDYSMFPVFFNLDRSLLSKNFKLKKKPSADSAECLDSKIFDLIKDDFLAMSPSYQKLISDLADPSQKLLIENINTSNEIGHSVTPATHKNEIKKI